MSNELELLRQDFGAMAPIFGVAIHDEDLGASISVSYGLLGYRGKTWSIRYKGNEIPLLRPDGDGPLNSVDVIIIKAPNHLSKVWYEGGWSEGSNAPPDCASSDGIVPDTNVPKKQNDVCLTCRWNAFGSRPVVPGQAPTKGKACADNKRLAIVPLGDIRNEHFGGPMLLRTPAASLGDLATFANLIKQLGFPYYALGVKISFDLKESFPKFIFKPIRPLTQEEGQIVLETRQNDLVNRIVHGDASIIEHIAPQATAITQQQPDNVVPIQQKQAAPTPQPQPAAVEPTGFGGVTKGTPPQQTVAAPAPQKTASVVTGFGGTGGVEAQPSSPQSESSGSQAFDQELDLQLRDLLK